MKINALKTAVLTFSVFTLALTAACSTSTTENNAAGAQTGAAGAKQTTPVKVRLAIDTAAGGSFQFRIAKEKGFFSKAWH